MRPMRRIRTSGSYDGLPGVAMVAALGVGLADTFVIEARVLTWARAWLFSTCCADAGLIFCL